MKKKSFLCIAAAVIVAAVCGMNTFASEAKPSYTESMVPLAKSNHVNRGLSNFTAGPNGYLNYFTALDDVGTPVTPKQFRSLDYGNTWQEINMDWCAEMKKICPNFGVAEKFYLADNGDIYCIASVGGTVEKDSSTGEVLVTSDFLGIFKYSQGKVQRIPNVSFGQNVRPDYVISHVYPNGDIVIDRVNGSDSTEEMTGVVIYGADGRLKSEVAMKASKWFLRLVANDAAYGVSYKDQGARIEAYDIRTGKKTISIPCPKDPSKSSPSFGVAKDGTVYLALSNGLYKCAPTANSFTKLLGGVDYKLGKNVGKASVRLACAEDGTVYLQVFDSDGHGRRDPENSPFGKIHRFIPSTR